MLTMHLGDGVFDVNKLRLEAGEWFAKETQSLEQPHDISADSGWRTEVHDVHRNTPADPVQPSDPLFNDRRFPRQVEEHQSVTELKVASLTAGFRGDQQARAFGLSESGDFQVALCR